MRADSIAGTSNSLTAVMGDSRIPVSGSGAIGTRRALSLRPETVSVTPAPAGTQMPNYAQEQGGEVMMPGRVLDLTYLGSLATPLCDTPLGRLRSETPTERLDPQIAAGSDVRLAWRVGDLRLLREDTAPRTAI